MLDRRNALPSGTALVLGREYTYTIQEEMGRGASCICYDALYADAAGLPHRVRIKECFPYYIDISRSRQGVLDVPKECRAQFASAKEKFYAAYLKNVELKLTLGLINSTADAIGIFDQNNTWYVVMGCVEGVDYRTETDSSLQSVFIRMKALSKIIQKYHSQGVLHLDIKPENILVIPETLEHMVLFDFDSLITAEELQKEVKLKATCAAADKAAGGTVAVADKAAGGAVAAADKAVGGAVAAADMASGADLEAGGFFSDGFAAPELVQGRWERICEATDLYAIGAITFYKLFGRTPSPEDAAMGATYDFSCMREFSCREQGRMAYPPELFQALTQFFQKTLSSFVPGRYQSAEEAIIFLDTLIRLSDPERPFLCSNFSYHSSCFVGRRAELREIAENLQGSHVLFLSGMGGIGKTEAARRFAYEHQECFRNILFVPFRDSILKTVCGSGIQIHRVQKAAGESEGEFFARKLQVMRQIATPEDLVILDNFDVESDPCLEDLLECPCKFLITSREDFRDYNYVQTEINRMEDMGELLALFRAYHPEEYEAGEEENVKGILELVEGHTMTVELIAKYLRDTGEMPSALLGKLLEADGLLGTGEKKVRQRKDRKLQAGSISRHLRALFNLSCFSEGESELIKSLSLMGAVRIQRDTFLGFCKMEGNGAFLANLIRRGWIQFEPDTEKVSLHQIIMDLVYHDMQPTSEQCPHFVASMAAYAQQECNGLAEWDVREGLLGRLLSRLRGEDLNYASLVVAWCSVEDPRFAHAEAICRRCGTKASKGLLQQICMKKLYKKQSFFSDLERYLEEGDFFRIIMEEVIALAKEAYGYAKEFSEESEYVGRTCVQLAKELDHAALDYYDWSSNPAKKKILSQIISYIAFLWKEAGNYFLSAEMDCKEKILCFMEIRKFFRGNELVPYMSYRTDICGDFWLAKEYQDIINELLEKAEPEVEKFLQGFISVDTGGVEWSVYKELGERAQSKGEYEKAIEYYEQELKEGFYRPGFIYKYISECYLSIGDIPNTIKYLKWIFIENDKGKTSRGWFYDTRLCLQLIDLLMENGKSEKARLYAKRMVRYFQNKKKEKRYFIYDSMSLISGYYRIFLAEKEEKQKKESWDLCVRYYEGLEEEEEWKWYKEAIPFAWAYMDSIPDRKGRISYAFKMIRHIETSRWDPWVPKIYKYIFRQCKGRRECDPFLIQALVEFAEFLVHNYWKAGYQKALKYCENACKLYGQRGMKDSYLYSRIHKGLEMCYSSLGMPSEQCVKEREKCDYYLLAEHDVKDVPVRKALKLWDEAAESCERVGRWKDQERCCQQMFQLFDPYADWMDKETVSTFQYGFGRRVWGLKKREKKMEILDITVEFYKGILRYYFFLDEKNCQQYQKEEFDFCECVRRIAADLDHTGNVTELFILYVLAIIAEADNERRIENMHAADCGEQDGKKEERKTNILSGRVERKVFEGIEDYFAGNWGNLLQAFRDILHHVPSQKMIGEVMVLWRDIQMYVKEEDQIAEFREEIQWFIDTYKYTEVAFKR